MSSDSVGKLVELKPDVKLLGQVVVSPKDKKLIIGRFKRSRINSYFGCGLNPWMAARRYDYKEEFEDTPYLDKLRVLTDSRVRDAKFNIRLYGASEDGEPDGYIYDKNIIGTAKKGKKVTVVDVSDLNILFPKEGFFVVIEWLIIEENKHEYVYTKVGSKKKYQGVSYEPKIGTVPSSEKESSWIRDRDKWRASWKNTYDPSSKVNPSKRFRNKYNLLAIELTLTN